MLAGVNACDLRAGFGGGQERFLRAALAAMKGIQPHTSFVVFTGPESHDSFDGYDRVFVEPSRSLLGRRFSQLAREAKKARVDLMLTPLDSAPGRGFPVPTVLYTMGLHGKRTARQTKQLQRLILSASGLVVPSEFVRKQLASLGAGLDRISVAPPGVDEAFGAKQERIVDEPYLLAVGDTRVFKNTERLQQVYQHVQAHHDQALVVVGRPCESEPAEWGPRVIRFEYCASEYLAALYQHCEAFVHCAHGDGAATCVLEAMRCGAPVVAWRGGAVPEYGSDVPTYPNADSVSGWVAALKQAMDREDEQRDKRLKVGRQLAGEHTWERCAWKILTALKHAAERGATGF